MSITSLLQKASKFEIQVFKKKPKDFEDLRKLYVAFSGAPLKHPYDAKKVILVVDPYSGNAFYYEFRIEDILFFEELPNIVNQEGESLTMARLWVKKKTVGIRCTPFIVEDIGSVHTKMEPVL
jgi:inorganic pyrophosphatase